MKSLQLVKKLEDKLLKSVGSFTFGKTIKDFEELKVKIKQDDEKFKELLRENTALKTIVEQMKFQSSMEEVNKNRANEDYGMVVYDFETKIKQLQSSLKQSMLNYDECYDKLVKCQKYIVDLENQIKCKSNGWMEK